MKQYLALASILPCSLAFTLQQAPWMGDVYAFNLFLDVGYSQYAKIDDALIQPSYAYNNYTNKAGLSFTPSESFDIEWEVEMARTPHQTYGFRASALQARYLLWNDIAGDIATVTLGANTRAVTGRSVRDVSSPYASYWNGEVTVSVGKEFSKESDWKTRGFLWGSLGLGNHGSFWDACKASFEIKFFQSHSLEAFGLGYFGYGSTHIVNIDDFHGWGYIRHSSFDLGARYSYFFDIWGTVSASYSCRVWAVSYPKREQTFIFSYALPFSLF